MPKPVPTPAAEQLRPGRHGLDREFVIHHQRQRILDAIAQEVAARGYPNVTAADVIARAGVSSKTFYDLFRDKADCFLAAYDSAVATLLDRIGAVFERMPEPTPPRTRAVLAAVLERLAEDPALARVCIVEVTAAGPEALNRYVEVVDGFISVIGQIEQYEAAKHHRRPLDGDLILRQGLVGGVAWIIYHEVVAGRTEQLPELLPHLTQFVLAPFIGERQAAAVARADDTADAHSLRPPRREPAARARVTTEQAPT
jgi:AcrR family transcriptional regulator